VVASIQKGELGEQVKCIVRRAHTVCCSLKFLYISHIRPAASIANNYSMTSETVSTLDVPSSWYDLDYHGGVCIMMLSNVSAYWLAFAPYAPVLWRTELRTES
jgi:hypothetical protein